MKVVHFLPVYAPAWQYGGPVLSVSRLAEGLVRHGVDVRVITTNAGLPDLPPSALGQPQNINGVNVTYYPVDRQSKIIRSRELLMSLPVHMQWADILHLSSIWQPLGPSVQKIAHLFGVPVIQTPRGALGPYSWRRGFFKKLPYFLLIERPLLQRATALHCTTHLEALELSWLRLKPPIKLLPNPIDLAHFRPLPDRSFDWRQKLCIPSSAPVLIVAGRFHHKKGLDLLPNVLPALSDLDWHIIFIGRDEDGTRSKLMRSLNQVGLQSRCHWLDQVPSQQLAGLYSASDCLLLPSRHENFGNVVVEALACGCAVLISNRVGVAESVRLCPGVHIAPRDPQLWISSLRSILQSSRPGNLSSVWTQKFFSTSLVASHATKMYKSILANE